MMYFGGLQIVMLEYIKRIHLRPSFAEFINKWLFLFKYLFSKFDDSLLPQYTDTLSNLNTRNLRNSADFAPLLRVMGLFFFKYPFDLYIHCNC